MSGNAIGALKLAMSAIEGMDANVSSSLAANLLETFFFGLYTFLGAGVLAAFLRTGTGTHPVASRLALLACTVMYALATAHLGINLRHLVLGVEHSRGLQTAALICVEDIADAGPSALCHSLDADRLEFPLGPAGRSRAWQLIALLVVNIVLSNAVLLGRNWVLWSRSRAVGAISVLLVLATAAVFLVSTSQNANLEDAFGTAAIFISWASNLWTAVMMSWNVWQRHEQLHGLPRIAPNARGQIFVVSLSIAYSLFWTVLMASDAVLWQESQSASDLRFLDGIRRLKASCFIDIVGMYATVVLLFPILVGRPAQQASVGLDGPSRGRGHWLAHLRVQPVRDSSASVVADTLEYDAEDRIRDAERDVDTKLGAGVL